MKFLENLKQKPRHGIVAPKPVGLVKITRKRTQIFRRERAYKAQLKGKWSAWRLCEMKLKTLIGQRQGEERAKKKMRTKTTSHHCHPTESPLPSLLQQPPLSLLLFPQARQRRRPRFHSPSHHRYAKAIITTFLISAADDVRCEGLNV